MKTMLIIDGPDSCETCPIRSYSNLALWCTPLRKTKEEDDVCPLRSMLRKKTPNGSDIFNDYVRGYNDAIDEILGETE